MSNDFSLRVSEFASELKWNWSAIMGNDMAPFRANGPEIQKQNPLFFSCLPHLNTLLCIFIASSYATQGQRPGTKSAHDNAMGATDHTDDLEG